MRILGGVWKAQLELIQFLLWAAPEFAWEAEVAVVDGPALNMSFAGVLGGEGFLDRCAVTFNQYYDYFAVEASDSADDRLRPSLPASTA